MRIPRYGRARDRVEKNLSGIIDRCGTRVQSPRNPNRSVSAIDIPKKPGCAGRIGVRPDNLAQIVNIAGEDIVHRAASGNKKGSVVEGFPPKRYGPEPKERGQSG